MDLAYTEEQQLLADSVQRFVDSNYDINARVKLANSDEGFSREHWQQYAELGWLALPFSEDDGGIGGSPVDTMVIMEEMGKGLVLEPFVSTVIMFGGAVDFAGNADQKSDIIPSIIDGSLMGAFAHSEENARYNNHHVETTAKADGDQYLLNGTKCVVMHAPSANKFVVSARTNGSITDESGITLFLVDAGAEGLTRTDYPTVDGLRASELTLEDVTVGADAVLGDVDQASTTIKHVIARTILATSAEAVGAMEVLYKDTIAYTSQREQFDHPLSDFQVLKHRMTDMFVEHSLAKSMCMKATMLEAQGTEDAARSLHALKYLVGKAGRFVSQSAVQLHGGMGMTEELRVAHYFKRLLVIDSQLGNADHHLEQFVG